MPLSSLKRQQQGFTLLEMMIAFVLISLLFLALFSSFNTMSKGWDKADKKMVKTEDLRLISEFLRRHLSEVLVVRIDSDIGPVNAFEGEGDYVRYAAPLQPLQGFGGIYLIELAIKDERSGKRLEMRYAPYRPEATWDEVFDGLEPVLVYEGFRTAEFEFFAAEDLGDEPEWRGEWVDELVYPLLLKLKLADEDRPWPELIVQLPQVDSYVMPSRRRRLR